MHIRLAVITLESGPRARAESRDRSRPHGGSARLYYPLRVGGRGSPAHPHCTAPSRESKADQRSESSRQGEGKRKPRARRPPRPSRKERRGDETPTTYREGLTAETPSMSPSNSSSSSSMGGSLALAAATAVAFSGSLVIFSLCRAHLSHGADPESEPEPELEPEDGAPEHALRPCLASPERRTLGGKAKKARRRRGERRVRFAADVVDNEGAPPARRHPPAAASASSSSSAAAAATCRDAAAGSEERMMPTNREALYRGMLRDRSAHRFTCSY